MRLLNSKSREMGEFFDDNIPPYAILSHTWREEEVTFQDMQRSEVQNKAGYSKILSCCEQAKLDGIEWVWVDTCCIDKTSSAELSEAINSMFAWYRNSEVCYALLDDVASFDSYFPEDEFKQALWFTRGWCLQELIAPSKIEFYAANWTDIGTKWSLHSKIETITGIPAEVLLRKSDLAAYTSAQKMSWASERQTTRQEDRAYSLLGIFGVCMPLLYGEGRRAFHRLQEEIMRQTEDYSLLLWTDSFETSRAYSGVLTSFPKSFPKEGPHASPGKHCDYRSITSVFLKQDVAAEARARASTHWNPPQMTTRGLRIHTFVRKVGPASNSTSLLLWTGCMYEQDYMCIMLHQDENRGFLKYGRSTNDRISLINAKEFVSFELFELYLNTGMRFCIRSTLCAAHRPDLEIILSTKCEESLSLVETVPSIQIHETGNCTQGQRLYCLNAKAWGMVSLKFKTCQHTSGITTGLFTVKLGLVETFPWCSMVPNSDMDLSCPNDAAIQDEFYEYNDTEIHSPYEEEPNSDRATGKLLNGRVVYAAAKGSSKPMPVADNPRQRKLALYTLYVTLFAGRTDISSRSLA